MKNFILILLFVCSLTIKAQLPPIAQALYTEMYNKDTIRAKYCLTNGAQVFATADGKSFYLKWFPAAATPSNTPLLVTMHGSDGNAFNEFFLWHLRSAAKGVGIIAVQWYRGAAAVSPYDYFPDDSIYSYIDTALSRIKYPSNKALFHGFSRGSARSYAIAFYDRPTVGKNYFCTIISNSGKPDSLYNLYSQINSGMYGHSLYNTKRWVMYCGGLDPGIQTCCAAMNFSKNWVQANGGTVGLYIQDPNLGHGGFQQTPAYMDSALNYYLPCYIAAGVNEIKSKKKIDVFPNPSHGQIQLNLNKEKHYTIELINCMGITLKEIKIKNEENLVIDTRFIHENTLFIKATDTEGEVFTSKCILLSDE